MALPMDEIIGWVAYLNLKKENQDGFGHGNGDSV